MNDFYLVDKVLEGDEKCFELIVKKYEASVFRVVTGLLHNQEDAEELTQDVFLKAYRFLPGFKKKSALNTWLYRLAINASLNFLRSKRYKERWTALSTVFSTPSTDANPEAGLIRKSDNVIIKEAIDALPKKQRLAFILTKYEELSQKEVAMILRISEGAVEQLVFRAKNSLRNKLQNCVGFDTGIVSNKVKRTYASPGK